MVDVLRKKSPRYPSLALDEALARAEKIYDRERLHPAPIDVVAQHMGYKGANNGASLGALASLRYYGLLERPKDGVLAVSKDVESYKFAPNEQLKRALLLSFLRKPPLYNELLDKYASGLPSDANLKFELIQKGFAPNVAELTLTIFKKSLNFVDYFNQPSEAEHADNLDEHLEDVLPEVSNAPTIKPILSPISFVDDIPDASGLDKIPVRLKGNRRAWLIIPTPFFKADKDRLKAQIDLLLTEEDDSSAEDLI